MASSNKTKTKRNLLESDLENEAAVFPIFRVIESLEEVWRAKFLLFLIEKLLLQGQPRQLLNKQGMASCYLRWIAGRWQKTFYNENISYDKMQNFPAWKTQHFQRSYQEYGIGIGYRIGYSIGTRKTWTYKYNNLHQKKRTKNPDQHLHPDI